MRSSSTNSFSMKPLIWDRSTRSAMIPTAAATWVLSYGLYGRPCSTGFDDGLSRRQKPILQYVHRRAIRREWCQDRPPLYWKFFTGRGTGGLWFACHRGCWSCRHTPASERLEIQTIWVNGGSIGEPPFLFSDPLQRANTKPVKDDGRYGREKRQADG